MNILLVNMIIIAITLLLEIKQGSQQGSQNLDTVSLTRFVKIYLFM